MGIYFEGPPGSVRQRSPGCRRLLDLPAAAAAAAVDAVPSPDPTHRGRRAPLLWRPHHDSRIPPRSLSRSSPRTRGVCRAHPAHLHEHPEHPLDVNGDRGELHHRAAPRSCAFRRRERGVPPHSATHGPHRAAPQHVIHGQGLEQRALRQLCGTVPPGENAGQRTDR